MLHASLTRTLVPASVKGKSLSRGWDEYIWSSCSAYFSTRRVETVIFDPFNCHKTCLKYPCETWSYSIFANEFERALDPHDASLKIVNMFYFLAWSFFRQNFFSPIFRSEVCSTIIHDKTNFTRTRLMIRKIQLKWNKLNQI